jgi:hypothetical protein
MAASFLRPSTFGTQDHDYLENRFGKYGKPGKLAVSWIVDVREMRRINQLILHSSDDTVMAYKSSQVGAVGMTAVAVCMSMLLESYV